MHNNIYKQIAEYTDKHLGKFLTVCLVLSCMILIFLVGSILSMKAYAANEPNAPKVIFTVGQSIDYNGYKEPESPKAMFSYMLKPITALAPMPEGCDSGGYTFMMEGSSEKNLMPIEYDSPGIFVYELTCVSKNLTDYEVDQRTYTIEEYVSDNLQVTTVIYGEEGTKMSRLAFAHAYLNNTEVPEEPEKPTKPNRPGTGNNSDRPNTSQSPNNQGKTGKPVVLSSPSTGDFSNPALWVMIIAISCVLLLLIIYTERKLKERHKK